jgi:hypothetical protein
MSRRGAGAVTAGRIMPREVVASMALAALLLAGPEPAWAYIGPGAGISMIGTVLALLGAIVLAITGLLWYPIKRLRTKARAKRSRQAKEAAS